MSRIKFEIVELADLVKQARLILAVEYLKPFSDDVMVQRIGSDVPVPPFRKTGSVLRVKATLKNSDSIDLPETIHVPVEGWRRALSQHKERHAGGPSKSYTVKQYKTDLASMNDAGIVFLRDFQGSFELEAMGAFTSITALDQIKLLIKAT